MGTPMVFTRFRRCARPRHLAWLLALALWLPAAQWAAATHALLHLQASINDDRDPPAHLPQACDTCVVAAVIGGGAPLPATTPALPAPPARHAEPLPPAETAARDPLLLAYRSRAPPLRHA